MTSQLIETFEDGVATLTMNRPEARNALTGEMQAALSEAITRLAADPAVRAVVLTGAGEAFCAGGDVKGFAARTEKSAGGEGGGFNMEARVHGLRAGMEVVRWLHEMPKPTLAVIPGPAAGAGLSLALACDLRIAANDAKLTTAFSKVGLAGDYGGSYFLTQLVGAAKARELYFTADVILGEEAARAGDRQQGGAGGGAGRSRGRLRPLSGRPADGGDRLYEAQSQRRRARHPGRGAGPGGDEHGAHHDDRGPQGRVRGVRGEAEAGVRGAVADLPEP